jgi:hypothetical protein
MKANLLLLPCVCFSAFALSAASAYSQTVVSFDDFDLSHDHGYSTNLPNGYQGLNWTNFSAGNSILLSAALGGYLSGYNYGMVSPSNVAYNAFGNPAEIDSPGTNFNFLSAYLTGAWNSNLNIEVEGFNGAQEIYDTIVTASATNPTLFTFNYFNIDRLYFNSYGGELAGFGGGAGENFVMDNFEFEFIPEPSSFLLAALGCISLVALVRPRSTRK